MRCHLQPMAIGRRAVADYEEAAGAEALERLRSAAEPLRGARVLHLAAAGSRLRSPELLPSLVPLLRDLGLDAEHWVMAGDRPLWRLVRELEDGLQGGETAITDDTWSAYLEASRAAARDKLEGWDAVVVHGPGPLGVAMESPSPPIWRFELDASGVDAAAWERLGALLEGCAACALPSAAYAPAGLGERVEELPEAIDPLGPGSVELPVTLAGSMLRSLGVDTSRPCCCQVRPFDTWQDPHDVLDAFAIAKEELPELQLVLAGDPARGDIEAWRLLQEVSDYAESSPDLLLLTGPGGLGNVELNALRRIARAALESALAPASTVTTLETLWKGTPVVSGGNRGAAHPVSDGREGRHAASPDEAAAAVVELVRDPGLAIEMGAAGHELVRKRFLVTRLLEDELRLVARARAADAATLQSP